MIEKTSAVVKKGLSLGATDVVAKGVSSRNQQLRFSNNEIDIAQTWYEDKIIVFMAYNKRVVATEIRNFEKINESVENLVKVAKVSQENPEYAGIAQGPFSYPPRKGDPQLGHLTDVSDYVLSAMNKALENATTAAGTLQVINEDIFLSTSGSVEAEDTVTSIELSIRAFSQREASGHSVTCSPTLNGFEPEKAGEEAGELAQLAKNPVLGEEGAFDIVFSPLFFGSLLSYSADMLSAFKVFAGRSMYAERVGERVASEAVTVADAPRGFKQRAFDDEGVPTREKCLIEKGILKSYLHNTTTAAIVNGETTGNAGVVIPEPSNMHMAPGDYTKEELVGEVDHGLYLTNTWYTRFQNMRTGDFSTIPRDAILGVEKGEISGSLKNIRLSDNLLQVYRSIEGLTRERKLVRWWLEVEFPCLVPHVLARKVKITRSTQ